MEEDLKRLRLRSKSVGSLPEIISCILGWVWEEFQKDRDQTIFACSLVNTIWNHESNRHLWHTCGTNKSNSHPSPSVQWLAAMAMERRMKYTQHIFILIFDDKTLVGAGGTAWNESVSIIARDNFPRLRHVCFFARSDLMITIPPCLDSFLKPNIIKFMYQPLFQNPAQQEELRRLLALLPEHCPGLRKLLIKCKAIPPYDMLFENLASTISGLKQLRLFDWSHWPLSFKVVEALASLPHLNLLQIPEMNDAPSGSYLDFEPERKSTPWFPSLQQLWYTISHPTAGRLLRTLPQLRVLWLTCVGTRTDHFRALADANIHTLHSFILSPVGQIVIPGDDLVAFAQSVPNLAVFEHPEEEYDREKKHIIWKDLDDTTMDKFLASLPKLKVLKLLFGNDDYLLTEQTLLSIGRHNLNLRICRITADLRIDTMLESAPTSGWRKLCSLRIETCLNVQVPAEQETTIIKNDKPTEDQITKLANLLPNLGWCTLQAHEELSLAVEERKKDIRAMNRDWLNGDW